MNYQIQANVTRIIRDKRRQEWTRASGVPTFIVPDCASADDAVSRAMAVILLSGANGVKSVSMTTLSENCDYVAYAFGPDDLAPILARINGV